MSENESGQCSSGTDWLEKRRDPENYEFGTTPHGEKTHIVGTGLPVSILTLGKQAAGDVPDGSDKALCGVVAEFDTSVEPPEDVAEVLDKVCISCNRQAQTKIANSGKFEEVPL